MNALRLGCMTALCLAATATWTASAFAKTVLRLRTIGEPVSLDWNYASTWVDGFILRNLMEGLVSVNTKLEAVPALAKSWEISPDNRVYLFHIRPEAKWSDGVPVRAQDFVNSWHRLLAPETGSKYASFLFDIKNAELFHAGTLKDFGRVGVRALDDHTLQVALRAAISYWYFIPTFYATYPVRQDLIDKNPKEWTKPGKLVTAGAFKLSRWDPGRSIVLERNSTYWGTHGNIDEVHNQIVADDSTALKLSKIASLDRNRLKTRADFRSWSDLRLVHLRMNSETGPTANIHLRRAIALAIDRKELAKLFENAYQPATSLVPPGMLGYGPHAGLSFNIKQARAELEKSGLDPAKLPPLDLLSPSYDDQVILSQFIQQELRRNLGLNVRIHVLEPKRYYSPQLVHTDYAMQVNFWGADFPDSDNFFSIFLSNSGLNRYHWTNSRYDDLVTDARSMSAKKEREKTYASAQRLLLEDGVATIPLYYGRMSGLVRSSVQNFAPGPMDWWDLKNISVK